MPNLKKKSVTALEAASEIGVGSLVGAEDIADPQGEHLGGFQNFFS